MAGHFDFLTFAGKTDVGRKRTNNEDNFGMFPEIGVWLVADGMGGGEDGEVASAAVVRAISGFAEAHPFPSNAAVASEPLVSGIADAIDAASQWIYNRTRERGLKSCASTVVGVVFDRTKPGRAVAFHAGDSRLYLIRSTGLFGGGIRQITTDHSAAEAMGVKEKEKLNPMWVNVITRAVGLHERTDVESTPFEVKKGDRILICSDGLSGMVDDKDLQEICRGEPDVAKTVEKLIAAANEAGGKDNVTAVLIEVGELPKTEVEAKQLKEIAVGVEDGTPDEGSTRPTRPTMNFESLTAGTVTSVSGVSAVSDGVECGAVGSTDNGEPTSACLDKSEIERLSGETPILMPGKTNRRRQLLWGVASLMIAFVVAGIFMSGGKRASEPKPTPVPRPSPVPVVETDVQRVAEPVAVTNVQAVAEPVAVTNVQAVVKPMAVPNVKPVVEPKAATNVQEVVKEAVATGVPKVAPPAEAAVDGSLADLAAAVERKSLSQFEAVVKNALRQMGDEGLKQVSEFSDEMRKVSARASKYVNEMRYVKGTSRSADDLVVDFRYALEKIVVLKPRLSPALKARWETVAAGNADGAEAREAVAALVTGMTESLK